MPYNHETTIFSVMYFIYTIFSVMYFIYLICDVSLATVDIHGILTQCLNSKDVLTKNRLDSILTWNSQDVKIWSKFEVYMKIRCYSHVYTNHFLFKGHCSPQCSLLQFPVGGGNWTHTGVDLHSCLWQQSSLQQVYSLFWWLLVYHTKLYFVF